MSYSRDSLNDLVWDSSTGRYIPIPLPPEPIHPSHLYGWHKYGNALSGESVIYTGVSNPRAGNYIFDSKGNLTDYTVQYVFENDKAISIEECLTIFKTIQPGRVRITLPNGSVYDNTVSVANGITLSYIAYPNDTSSYTTKSGTITSAGPYQVVEIDLPEYVYCCVPYYTAITYSDNTTKIAEEVKVGDDLLGYNETTGEFTTIKVLNVIHKLRSELIKIKTTNHELEITPDHPILTDQGWAVYDLNVTKHYDFDKIPLSIDLKVLTQDGTYEDIVTMEFQQLETPIDTYTFNTTDGIDTYISAGLISHNAPDKC